MRGRPSWLVGDLGGGSAKCEEGREMILKTGGVSEEGYGSMFVCVSRKESELTISGGDRAV